MSRVESPRPRTDRPAQPARAAKRPKIESTSFDRALAQALSGPKLDGAPLRPAEAEPSSDGSEQSASAPKRMTGADAPAAEATKGTTRATRPTEERSGEPTHAPTEGSPAPEAEPAAGPGTSAESAPASPQLEAVRVESKGAARAVAASAGRPTSASDGSGAMAAVVRTTSESGPRRSVEIDGANAPEQAPEGGAPTETPAAPKDHPTSQVTVRFGKEDGASGRIRLAVRGQALHATIISSDRDAVRQWNDDLGDLHRSLLTQGFVEANVTVRHAQPPDSAAASRRGPGDRTPEEDSQGRSADPREEGRRDGRFAS